MSKIDRLTPELREDLVAYLDGELEAPRAAEIDQALATNPVVRREVEMLTRTWEMLDVLPRESASEEFTARTLQTIVLSERETFWHEQPWYQALKTALIMLGYFVGLAAIGVLAFMTTYRWIPDESDPLLDELPVIENYHRYTEADSLDYLKRLDNQGAFYDDLRQHLERSSPQDETTTEADTETPPQEPPPAN